MKSKNILKVNNFNNTFNTSKSIKVIAVVNRKGGVGKTTTAFQIASWLAMKNKKILAVDSDPQGNFTKTASNEIDAMGLYEILTRRENINDLIEKLGENKFDLIHSDDELARAESVLLSETDREYRLKEAFADLKNEYDYVVIDTPPSLSVLTTNAMVAADILIVTAQADTYSTSGLMTLYNDVNVVKKYCNPNLIIDGILITRFAPRTSLAIHVREILKELAEKMQTKLYNSVIRETTVIRESQAAGQSIFDYAPKSAGALDYENFMLELFRR